MFALPCCAGRLVVPSLIALSVAQVVPTVRRRRFVLPGLGITVKYTLRVR
jgi:hypothetical protein